MIKLHAVQRKGNIIFCIDDTRIETNDNTSCAVIEGWAVSEDSGAVLSCKVDGEAKKGWISFVERQDVVDATGVSSDPKKAGFIISTPYIKVGRKKPIFELFFSDTSGNEISFFKGSFPKDPMDVVGEDMIFLALDSAIYENKLWTVRGWTFAEKKDEKGSFVPVDIKAFFKGKPIKSTVLRQRRPDVVYPSLSKDYNAGFSLSFKKGKGALEDVRLSFETKGGTVLYRKLTGIHDDKKYEQRRQNEKADEEELIRQRNTNFSYNPLISILVPVYKTDEKKLAVMIESVLSQTYQNFELCIADASCDGSKKRKKLLNSFVKKDKRVQVTVLTKNLGISGNTNRAMELSKGEWIALLDHDDTIEPDALFCMVEAMQEPDVEMVYTDEDKMDGEKYFEPHDKKDFDMELLYKNNYICHFLAVKRTLIPSGELLLNSEYDGAQDYDLVLRSAERAKKVAHVKRILYHWRAEAGSTAVDQSSKTYAFDAGLNAINASLKRTKKNAHAEKTELFFNYRVVED